MLEITPDMKQIIITKSEANRLNLELEKIFCEIDHSTANESYSYQIIVERYPLLAEFFLKLR